MNKCKLKATGEVASYIWLPYFVGFRNEFDFQDQLPPGYTVEKGAKKNTLIISHSYLPHFPVSQNEVIVIFKSKFIAIYEVGYFKSVFVRIDEKELKIIKEIQGSIDKFRATKNNPSVKDLSDGYHTFGELYDYRLAYNALLFNTWAKMKSELKGKDIPGGVFGGEITITAVNGPPLYDVHKSWKHNDGEWCFGTEKEYFIVVAILPTGQITNHYKAEHWSKFVIPESPKAKYPFDGHTSKDVLERMDKLLNYEMDKTV